MNCNKYFTIVHLLLFSFCLCEISVDQKDKLLNGFIDYYNKLHNQIYTCNEGSLQNTQQVNENTYQIEATLKVTEIYNVDVTKLLKCTATVQDLGNAVTVTNHRCQEHGPQSAVETGSPEQVPVPQVEVTEPTLVRKPVQLDNEVQSEAGITSGEQFIAIPRDQPSAPCIGCATHVNPQAAGVSDLANLGVRHLDIHEPAIKHSLNNVLDVERQVQVVNGVRYLLTLSINFDNCSEEKSENCASSKTCKITILVKPWVKLPNGANYRAILANNCTEEWQYGDNGEVLPELTTENRVTNNVKGNTSEEHNDANAPDYDIRVKHNKDVQSLPDQERSLTDDEIKTLQEQIIPNSQFLPFTESHRESVTLSPDTTDEKQHVFKVESGRHSENSIPVTESEKIEQQAFNINPDKKKAIDEMLDFFDFSGFKPKTEVEETMPRIKRSYDYDLQVLSLAKDYHEIKKSIENAKFVYEMAQAMVDYLNEMDMEVKNRVVNNVIKAEEELDHSQHFMYVQASVTIPCDKVECETKDTVTQICNAVIDSTNKDSPQIMNTFCYYDNKEREHRDIIKEVSFDDPVLQKLTKEAVKKIESESTSPHALKINKIVSANTQTASGRLTKISVIVDHINCNKSVPLLLRINCTVVEQLGSKICEIIIHERHWLKEKKISYTCIDRPVDMRISKTKSILKNITVNDPKIIEMLQEAIQYLETQSNKNNKQKIVSIKSISSQIIAGFLTKIEFVVGYTNCTDENYPTHQLDKCELLKNYGLRICKAQIWDRSWIMDGRQVEVTCDDAANEIENTRKKRSIDLDGDSVERNIANKDLEYKQLADESLKKFLKSSSSRQHYEVVKVDRAAVQSVPGKLIKIDFTISPTNCLIQSDGRLSSSECNVLNPKIVFRCHSKILEQVWVDKKQYSVNCNTKDQKQNEKNSVTGLKQRNPSESKYYKLAEESLKKYLHDTGNSPHHVIVKLEKVTTQIVSGLLTTIDFIISPKSKTASASNDTIKCNSKILEKHWLGTKDLNVTCEMKEKVKSYNLTENTDSPKYMQIAVVSLQKYIKDNPDSHPVRVTFVDKVTQVGEIIKLDFVASRAEDDDGDSICHAKFSEQGLDRNDIEVKCHLIGTILRKNEITEEDPNYLKYVQLADESLYNYLQTINSSQRYTIINISKVTVQWHEGLKILIDFIVSPVDSDNIEFQGKRCISQILEQPWLHKKRIDVKCEEDKDIYRIKREIFAGGQQEKDPTKSEYKVLADQSLMKYIEDSGTQQPLEVVRVVKVTTQVVSGSLTRIEFVVSGSPGSDTITCKSKIWEQAWLKKKDIDVSCGNDVERAKREIGGVPGGESVQDPTDPAYEALAKESLRKYVEDSGTQQPLEVVRVVKVTTQVVSGSLTRIEFIVSGSPGSDTIPCKSKIWEQPWLKKKDIDVSCGNDVERAKREIGGIPGGESVQDSTDPKYEALAKESLRKYVQDSGTQQPLEVVRVVKVTTQVVSGSLTRIEFIVSGSPGSDTITCKSKIWEQPWLKKKDIDVSCGNDVERAKREIGGIPGGESVQDPTDPKYEALAKESLRKYVQDSGTQQPLEVVRVVKVTTQVVSGSLTRIEFVVSGSPGSDTITCKSKIWEQTWLKKKDIDVSCGNDVERAKREIGGVPGGESVQDPTDPAYEALAKESLRKYVEDSGTQQPLEVVRVVKVTTQVVSGSLTRIEFIVSGSPGSDTIKCKSKIWEQPWLKKKDIDVSCGNDVERAKREIGGITGGETVQDPTDPAYEALAKESLRKYVDDSGTQQPLEVVRVVKVTTQVVSGSLTRIEFIVSGSPGSDTITCKSKIWEQPWLKKKDIDVSCGNDVERAKREIGDIPGGESVQDPTDPKYEALAKESLRKYVQDSGTQQPLEVVRVVKVTTQVVSGSLTRIEFVVSGSPGSDTITCKSKIWEQAWLKKKDIDVSCGNDVERAKREIGGIPGGESVQDPTDPKYEALAKESLRKYVEDSGTQQPLEVVRVVKVTTQVVSGSLTRIEFIVSGSPGSDTITCKSKIWEQPWLKKKDIDVSCGNDVERAKREIGGIPGGESVQDPTDPKYEALAKESLRKYVEDSGTQQPLEVVRVVKVTTQVVSGSLTRIEFIVSGSPGSDTITCKSKIWEQPWLKKKDIDVSCGNDVERAKREIGGIPGGESVQDPTDPKYEALAKESLRKYVQDSGTQQPLEVVRVVKVTTQVVSGSLTRIEFIVSGSPGSDTITCKSKIWEQPWLKKKDIDVSCGNDVERAKREIGGIPGGESVQDPTDPKYEALAKESLRKYVQDSGTQQPLEVVRVVKVTTQVVSGSLTRIEFVVSGSPGSDTITCKSKIWEQTWLKKKDIDVSCGNDVERAKREIGGVPGGESVQDPTDPAYEALAKESLRKYVEDSGTQQPLEVVRVVKVTTQVVSGSLTRIEFVVSGSPGSDTITCKSKIWEQPWLKKKDIDVSCGNDVERAKREIGGVPGGESVQDPTDPAYEALAKESLRKYVEDSGTQQPLEVVRVVKVTTQVVSGTLTRIEFIVSGSPGSDTITCKSKIWEQPWLKKKDIDVSCGNDVERAKREIGGIPGGESVQDPTDPKYEALAKESLRKYVEDSGTQQPLEVVRVVKVTTQVVSGSLTRIEFIVSGSPGSDTITCKSKIWEQPWLKKKDIDVSCGNDVERAKREIGGIPGGESVQDPTDPKYEALAKESLRKYVQDSGTQQPLEVVRVVKVTTQVVSGSLTRIEFVVSGSPGSDTITCKSKIWEQTWLKKKDIDVSCGNDVERAKREIGGVPGGESVQDPTDPAYEALAKESLRKYVEDSGTQQPLEVVRVVKVTTQVVSGSLTRIEFVVSGSPGSDTITCKSKIWEQPWLKKKDIDVSCGNDVERAKREIGGVPGGESVQDPTDPAYEALAKESLRKYVEDSGTQQPLEVVRVVKVTTQVVSGTLTRIEFIVSGSPGSDTITCKSKIWEQPWLKKKDIDVSCGNDVERAKREIGGIPGGESVQDPTDPKYEALAKESLRKYVEDSGTQQPLEVVRVVKVTTQVVSGSLTRIEFIVSGSPGSDTITCKSKIWEQPWLKKKDIDVSCGNDVERAKREIGGIPGGESVQDPTDPKYEALAKESLRKYVQDSGTQQPLEVVRVVKVTTQVVSGSLTRIEFIVSGSPGSDTITCKSKIWEQPWLKKKDIDVSCGNDVERAKREIGGIPGGESVQDPTDPKYEALAKESLRKYVQDSGTQQPLEVVRVVKVTTQVVSGSLTRIEFVVSGSPGSDTITCKSKIWEQTWLKKKDIDVSCGNDVERAKREIGGVPGGESVQDPTDPAYEALAKESLRKYVEDSGTQQPLEVVRVVKVTTQVVSGSLTRIEFVVSGSPGSDTITCKSKIWEQSWLKKKDIDVSCGNDVQRAKREIGGVPGGETVQDLTDPMYEALAKESLRKYVQDSGTQQPLEVVRKRKLKGKNKERQFHAEILGRQTEEEQDPSKQEYKLLAEESLRKYQQKSGIYHKVVAVERVMTRVVSGFKYKIDFNAAPTECLANISNLHAHSCKAKDDVILYCHTEIWDRPWLKQKKIDIECNGPDNSEIEDYKSDLNTTDSKLNSSHVNNNNNNIIFKILAEEATEKYLSISNRIYVHKVIDIISVSENIADGTITKIEYTISPTTCLRNETRGSYNMCDIKQPLIILHCNAKIWDRPWMHLEKDIGVNCKKMRKSNKQKRELGVRTVRQIGDDDDIIDEDTTYYYADRAVQHVNDHSASNNLHKLVSIHAVQSSFQMKTMLVRLYIELAETYCLRHHREVNLHDCEEMDGLNHRLCLARVWPSPDDELVVRHVSVVCDDEQDFTSVTALNIPELLKMSIAKLEKSPDNKFKLVHQGEPHVIPSLDSKYPIKLNFIIATTNCSKDVNLDKNPFQCFIDTSKPSKACHSFIWLVAETRTINFFDAKCTKPLRSKRSIWDPANVTTDNLEIQKLVKESLEKLEMLSLHRYKQRVLQINSHSTKITSGKVTTIDFDVGYTSCLKYEWVENITSCDFIEHLPRRRCVAQIWERLWINNGKNIDVNCVDDDTPLETHIEFDSAEMANQLAREALRHIEAKYPHPRKQKVVRIFSLEKQVVAGVHYRMKVEVGFTDCLALSEQTDCKLMNDLYMNKFCRVNVWLRPWTDHPPNYRVSCDYQEGATQDLYHQAQAEHLFYNFLTTYSPSYVNDFTQLHKRFEIFKKNVKKIHEFNVYEKGTARYGVTRFTDLTYEEFRSTYMGLNTTLRNENLVPMKKADIPDIKVPQSFDWREFDAVTDVKDQGSCGSCWAFSVTGNIEGQWKMQSGQLVSLSEQELVDCDKMDDGCNGGLPDNAYRAIEQLGGLELEIDYPYEAEDEKCEFNKTLAKVQISGAVNITTNETGMAQWLVHNGPISIGINANAMQFYMGGISHPWKMLCNPTNLDHGVLIVGYGVKEYPLFNKRLPYWIVKNSWGKSWGEQGYYRVYRGDGTCGVNQMASSAVI